VIEVTETAQGKLKEVLASHNKPDAMIRVYIGGIG